MQHNEQQVELRSWIRKYSHCFHRSVLARPKLSLFEDLPFLIKSPIWKSSSAKYWRPSNVFEVQHGREGEQGLASDSHSQLSQLLPVKTTLVAEHTSRQKRSNKLLRFESN